MTQTALHTINQSPFASKALDSCLRLAVSGSTIVLLEDAVIAALATGEYSHIMQQACQQYSVYALLPDVQARGLAGQTLAEIPLIDYHDLVDLTVAHYPMQQWS